MNHPFAAGESSTRRGSVPPPRPITPPEGGDTPLDRGVAAVVNYLRSVDDGNGGYVSSADVSATVQPALYGVANIGQLLMEAHQRSLVEMVNNAGIPGVPPLVVRIAQTAPRSLTPPKEQPPAPVIPTVVPSQRPIDEGVAAVVAYLQSNNTTAGAYTDAAKIGKVVKFAHYGCTSLRELLRVPSSWWTTRAYSAPRRSLPACRRLQQKLVLPATTRAVGCAHHHRLFLRTRCLSLPPCGKTLCWPLPRCCA